jgi:hypothetical protein
MELKVLRLDVKLVGWLIVVLAFFAVAISLFVLFHPSGGTLLGDGDNASAISSALALIVATIGLVLAIYMQSAEYRRATEVVDSIQSLRMILSLMIAKIALIQAKGDAGKTIVDIKNEKEQLLLAVCSNAGSFLRYIAAVRHREAEKRELSEEWRLLDIYMAAIFSNDSALDCKLEIIGLYRLLDSVTSDDLHRHSRGFISTESLDVLRENDYSIVVKAMIELDGERKAVRKSAPIDHQEIATRMRALEQKFVGIPEKAGLLDELRSCYQEALKGDSGSAELINEIWKIEFGDG